jgi:hypothetical protein
VVVTVMLPIATLGAQGAPPSNGGPAWAAVQEALGGRGTMQAGGVLRFGFPRTDLTVMVRNVKLAPSLALGSWVAFKRSSTDDSALMMGDLVLTENEVGPVMLSLQQNGVQQTALHHHVLHETPRVLYMHVEAHGDAVTIARALRVALAQSATPVPSSAAPASPATPARTALFDLDTVSIARTLGAPGRLNGGVLQFSIPRAERITMHGEEIPPAMGVATAINVQPTGNGMAAVTGDFVLTASEVNPVIRALREHGIEVTAVHSHMLEEAPRLFFLHFWAHGDADQLAGGLRVALDLTARPGR